MHACVAAERPVLRAKDRRIYLLNVMICDYLSGVVVSAEGASRSKAAPPGRQVCQCAESASVSDLLRLASWVLLTQARRRRVEC